MPQIPNDETLLKILQYEGKERSANKLIIRAKLGDKVIKALDIPNNSPIDIIETVFSMLGFLVMQFSKTEEIRNQIIMKICFRLMENSNISREEILAKHAELKAAGIFNSESER